MLKKASTALLLSILHEDWHLRAPTWQEAMHLGLQRLRKHRIQESFTDLDRLLEASDEAISEWFKNTPSVRIQPTSMGQSQREFLEELRDIVQEYIGSPDVGVREHPGT